METFDIVYFFQQSQDFEKNKEVLRDIIHQLKVEGHETITCIYDRSERDFREIEWGVYGLRLKEDTYRQFFRKATSFVNRVFEYTPLMDCAAGIYEINETIIASNKVEKLSQFDATFLMQYPIVFLRKTDARVASMPGKIIAESTKTLCFYQDNVQIILDPSE